MKKANDRVAFVSMKRPKRGKYIASFHLISDKPAAEPEYALTKRALAMLEESIREAPHLYLWSHNRWKRTFEEYQRRQQENLY